jgi:hypothetical protein
MMEEKRLYWNDPDPIHPPEDYKVINLQWVRDDMYYIHYDSGHASAEVHAHELELR